ncbi:MAG TPA: inorganic phosphate transporter [Sphingomonadales bacterium]
MAKHKLHKDLKRLSRIEQAARLATRSRLNLGVATLFLAAVFIASLTFAGVGEGRAFIVAAGVIGAYMAMNIGANDVANNIGPAVGSRAISLGGALLIAATFEAAGAILAGGDVVQTIAKDIIDNNLLSDREFVYAMLSALFAAALWLNLATAIGAPVSTTHSVVGAVIGAGIVSAGFSAINWPVMGAIVASWVVSPVMGGVLAAAFLLIARSLIFEQADRVAAARRWVPVLVAVMATAFAAYLLVKGLRNLWRPDALTVTAIAVLTGVGLYLLARPMVFRASVDMENRRKAVSGLFGLPLIGAATLLSFAHGANDVANAVGPLAAIANVVQQGDIAAEVTVPRWVMLIGALGISIGLLTFGPRVIRMVGQEITRLDQTRAFCAAMSAAITVLVASWLGLPVSSTHIAVGGVFGVGFLREYLANRNGNGSSRTSEPPDQAEMRKMEKRRLVRRRHVYTIAAAWVITVPLSALLAMLLYLALTFVFPVNG